MHKQAWRIVRDQDGLVELPELFMLELTDPTGGVPIYESQRQFEIEDNELNPLRVDPDFRPAVRYQPSGYAEGGRGLLFLPDGRMILPTPLWRLTGEDGEGIVRLLHNGDLDLTFAMAKVLGLRAMTAQASGQVLIGGGPDLRVNGLDFGHVIRLNADGSFDEAFQARWPSSPGTTVTALAVQPDGKVLVATSSASGGTLLRLEPNGTTDPLFQVARIADAVERIVVDQAGAGQRTCARCGRSHARLTPATWRRVLIRMGTLGPFSDGRFVRGVASPRRRHPPEMPLAWRPSSLAVHHTGPRASTRLEGGNGVRSEARLVKP